MKYYEFVNLFNRVSHEGWNQFDMAMFLVGYKGDINQKDIDNIQKYTN